MSIQKTTVARARKTDPQTSHDAAEKVKRIEEQRRAILALLEGTPMCDEKLLKLYETVWKREGFPAPTPSGVRTRRNELVKAGLVEKTALKERMKTGGWGIVWRVSA
jgi:hypothetical protein